MVLSFEDAFLSLAHKLHALLFDVLKYLQFVSHPVEHALLTLGVSVQAPHGDAGEGDGHALSSLLHPRARTSEQRLKKKKKGGTIGSVGLVFFIALKQ